MAVYSTLLRHRIIIIYIHVYGGGASSAIVSETINFIFTTANLGQFRFNGTTRL